MRLFFITFMSALNVSAATFHLKVEVVDEDGKRLPSVVIAGEALPVSSPNIWNAPGRRKHFVAKTDADGFAKIEEQHILPQLVISASADNFYTSSIRVTCEQKVVKIILVRKLEQVKSRKFEIITSSLPQDGRLYGFDLIMGAFTTPLGVGRYPDVFIKGICPPVSKGTDPVVPFIDQDLEMHFPDQGTGFQPTPRPGQKSFSLSVAPSCEGQMFSGLDWPRRAPRMGYAMQWRRREFGITQLQGRAEEPQWIFRIRPEEGYYHGVMSDFRWLPDGRLRLVYEVSTISGSQSLEFSP